ncbi:KilA-N domain-containing protein [Oxalobacter formigenes]|uniref:KilA-N domain-containing protein n=1 Tax=Oxalobacter formigenes TaxID=847 RepID=UPI000A2A2573|nr:KilA-N domain-containing protein [Oxalobacter formigenes]ARQ46097.1 KilA-N domain protein [Oxalobacter formigenes]MCZ4062674.1 KilA-N domain-containing protein [Oxalobacter formigenes]QDX33167.1 KilA-N domain-containing protein [Oxalobacter formigenes]
MTNIISIGSSAIRQQDGLYSLNDLHKASGGNKKHQPSNFLRLEATKALISEIDSSSHMRSLNTVAGKGRAQGSYVCKELVIAYAAWISPAFHLKVIRVFLDSAKAQVVSTLPAVRVITTEEQTAINMRAHVLVMEKYREIRGELMSDYLSGKVDDLDIWIPQETKSMSSVDIAEMMREGLPVSSVDIPKSLADDMEKKAWEMSRECYDLCIDHLRRAVEYRCVAGGRLNLMYAKRVVKTTTLGNALLHKLNEEKERIEELLQFVRIKADKALNKIQGGVNE